MGRSTIVSRYISQTGRKSGPIHPSNKNNQMEPGPGRPHLKHATFNWKQEIVIDVTDGTQKSYELRYKPIYQNTLSVYINGILQRQNEDYVLDGKVITFNDIIPSGFNIVAKYNAMQMEL